MNMENKVSVGNLEHQVKMEIQVLEVRKEKKEMKENRELLESLVFVDYQVEKVQRVILDLWVSQVSREFLARKDKKEKEEYLEKMVELPLKEVLDFQGSQENQARQAKGANQ